MTQLFRIVGFAPFVAMVFLNAFVDLGHKIIIQNTLFKAYDGSTQILLTAVVNALILLPFVLLFTPAGYLSDRHPKPRVMRVSAAVAVGKAIADKAKAAGISRVAFDRSGFKYHGRVKALADAAREGGLKF